MSSGGNSKYNSDTWSRSSNRFLRRFVCPDLGVPHRSTSHHIREQAGALDILTTPRVQDWSHNFIMEVHLSKSIFGTVSYLIVLKTLPYIRQFIFIRTLATSASRFQITRQTTMGMSRLRSCKLVEFLMRDASQFPFFARPRANRQYRWHLHWQHMMRCVQQ